MKKKHKSKKSHISQYLDYSRLLLLTVPWCNLKKKKNPKQTLRLLKQTYLQPRANITEHVWHYYCNFPCLLVHIY